MNRLLPFFLTGLVLIVFTSATRQNKQQVFLQLVDPSGQMIRGTSTTRGYEKQIIATNFSGVTTGNPQVQISMPSDAASASLANVLGGKQKLPYAIFTITQ